METSHHDARQRLAHRLDRTRSILARREADLLRADRLDPDLTAVIVILERVAGPGAARWWTSPALGLAG